ncbi:Phosphatidylserine synthase 2 [Hondaea fermentalgiana]|uniref:Phosphatidylserine synthase 2 n=1 Tax=Hondaea fermentalgiana TaxID=2315210 RepID=A0A2R5G2R8_9STRA|nr:Phosphatidylserine synthase 2 [Hondaea fermentalgiana]|eukprot:GBG25300.1 Phosphatidylserine synthase 2 [Hondaea fermentalgiana]
MSEEREGRTQLRQRKTQQRAERGRTPERKGKRDDASPAFKARRDEVERSLERSAEKRRSRSLSASSTLEAASPGNIQEEGFIDAFYQPRTVTGLVLLVFFIVYLTIWKEDEIFTEENRLQRGLLLAASAFLLYSMIQLRDGHLLRPHPAVWRVVHGTGLLYFMILVYLLAQDIDGITSFLQLFDKTVGPKETEHSYGDDCRLYAADDPENPYKNIKNQLMDRFVIAHAAGYALKALILRDWALLWIVSVMFEVLEVTFQHMYPNFNECWWDHLFLDVFGCNFIGMIVGMAIVRYMGTHQFNWTGRRIESFHGYFGKMKRVALQFTPRSFETYDWHLFESWRRFAVSISVIFILLLGEMNAFFLKSTFNIPIKSDINLYRLSFWVFMTYMATFEFHRYAEGKSRRIGVNSWLAASLVSLETLLVVKHTYQQNLFRREHLAPASYIMRGWTATLVLVLLMGAFKYARWAVVRLAGAKILRDETIMVDTDDKDAAAAAAVVAEARRGKIRSSSIDLIEAVVPGSAVYMRAERTLTTFSRVLTYLIPLPLVIVLLIDCYRTAAFHPPPMPGKTNGW